jgi:hypothetical protein
MADAMAPLRLVQCAERFVQLEDYAWRSARMMPDIAINQCENIFPFWSSCAISWSRSIADVCKYSQKKRTSVAFSWLHTTRGRRGTDDTIVTGMSLAILSLLQQRLVLSSSEERGWACGIFSIGLVPVQHAPAQNLSPRKIQSLRISAEVDVGEAVS